MPRVMIFISIMVIFRCSNSSYSHFLPQQSSQETTSPATLEIFAVEKGTTTNPKPKKTLTNSAAGSRNPSQRHIPAINKLMIFRKLINRWWCWRFCSNSGKSISWSSMDGKLQGQGPLSSLPWFLFCAWAAESWGIHVSGTILAKT